MVFQINSMHSNVHAAQTDPFELQRGETEALEAEGSA